jgi:hypothetical protein
MEFFIVIMINPLTIILGIRMEKFIEIMIVPRMKGITIKFGIGTVRYIGTVIYLLILMEI